MNSVNNPCAQFRYEWKKDQALYPAKMTDEPIKLIVYAHF